MDTLNDQIFINRCLDGDREAFRELVVRYQKHIGYTIYKMIYDSEMARDLSQEVFIKAYTKLFSYDSRYPFKVWITRIATCHTIDYLRKRKPEYTTSTISSNSFHPTALEMARSREPMPDETISRKERAGMVTRALQTLDPKLRMVIVLRHYHDMNYSEIADALNIPIGTVKNRLFRAREKLQDLIINNPMMLQEVVS
jgi:RNA polymerase sigma factor (sigma-70 family)